MQKAVSQATQQLQDLKKIQEKEKEMKDPDNNLLKIRSDLKSDLNHDLNCDLKSPATTQNLFINTSVNSMSSMPPFNSYMSPYSTQADRNCFQPHATVTQSWTNQLDVKTSLQACLSPQQVPRLDLPADENIELEELEDFAKEFKQRRIKLGYTQVINTIYNPQKKYCMKIYMGIGE